MGNERLSFGTLGFSKFLLVVANISLIVVSVLEKFDYHLVQKITKH